jgi:hypothetical protein
MAAYGLFRVVVLFTVTPPLLTVTVVLVLVLVLVPPRAFMLFALPPILPVLVLPVVVLPVVVVLAVVTLAVVAVLVVPVVPVAVLLVVVPVELLVVVVLVFSPPQAVKNMATVANTRRAKILRIEFSPMS